MTSSGSELLRANINDFDAHTTWGARAARRRLVDAGDHVVWHDGDQKTTWHLPDQPAAAALPTLSRVVYAQTAAVMVDGGMGLPETHVLLVAADGRTLETLAVAGASHTRMSDAELEKIWPRSGFDRLAGRGVTIEDVETRDIAELRRRFPGSVSRSRVLMYSRRTFLVYVVLIALAIAAAYILTRD